MWATATVLILLTAGGTAILAAIYGHHHWKGATAELRSQLEGARSPVAPPRYESGEIEGLPPPVKRYFRTVLEDGQPMVASVEITHGGEFNLDESGERWVRFRSSQLSVMRGPGFVWDARMSVAPGLKVFVHDGYVVGRGVLHARVLGLVSWLLPEGPTPYWRGTIEAISHEMSG